MRRRDFITLLGGGAAWRLAARAQQQAARVRRIGVLIGVASDAETKAWVATFRKRLDELGWQVGRNVDIDERWTAGDPEQNRVFAAELVASKPDAIFAFWWRHSSARAARCPLCSPRSLIRWGAASWRAWRVRAGMPRASPISCRRWRRSGWRCSRRSRRRSGGLS